MKKSSVLVIIIPLLIALLVVGSVLVVRYMSPVPEESRAAPRSLPADSQPTPASYPSFTVPTGKPEVGFDQIQSTEPVSDLRQALDGASNSGVSDLDYLEQEASSL